MYILTIDSKILAALKLCSAKYDIRAYLNAICVEIYPDKKESRLIATDSHVMAVYRKEYEPLSTEKQEELQNAIIPIELFKSIGRGNEKEKVTLSIDETVKSGTKCTRAVTVTYKDKSFTGETIEHLYVDWQRCFPSECSGEVGRFSATVLKQMAEVSLLVSGERNHPHIWHNGDRMALVELTGQDAPDFVMTIGSCSRYWSHGIFNGHAPRWVHN